MDFEVVVSVVDARNDRPATEVDPLGSSIGKGLDPGGRTGREDAAAADRQRPNVRMRRIARENLSVEQDQIGSALSCGREYAETQDQNEIRRRIIFRISLDIIPTSRYGINRIAWRA